ncbi:hypothetical protein BDN72DRAFT_898555 [Pluteus cervinus]|uniref:Uncharacterized protein n=1 Tax=Pluteus cervinus TaxID=181527 RepID=A0ACD3AQQ6_9AGAR|nr:hypothetical protein BDN72DRAFT_898555 [Pluteus cervinus]
MAARQLSEPLEALENVFQASSEESDPPIHHLPPELLTRVFICFRRIGLNDYPPDRKKKPVPWMVILEVCRNWRDTALESPMLWSYIPRSYPGPIVERCLRLSNSAPLVVHINMCTTKNQIYLKEAISQFRSLKVSLFKTDFQELSFLRSSPAPLLESLSIDMLGHSRNGRFVLDNICAGITPQLRNLALQGCGVNLSSSFLTNLSILDIRNPTQRISGTAFLSVLRGLPSLVSLRMCRTLQLPEDQARYAQIPHTKIVELPSLRLLSFYGLYYIQDLDFLSHLSFPSTTTLLFASGYPDHHRSPIAALSDFLKVHASVRQNFEQFTPTKVILNTLYGRLKLDLMNDNKTLCAFKLDSRPTRERHQLQCGPDLDELLSYLSFPSITHLSTSFYVAPSAWPVISPIFPELNQLSVEGMSPNEVATILSAIIEDFQTKSDFLWVPILPHLQTLHLMHVVVDDNCKEHLVKALRGRIAASSGLEKMGIDECDQMDDNFVRSLSAVEGLNAIRRMCDGADEERKALRRKFAYSLDTGLIMLPVGEIDPRCHHPSTQHFDTSDVAFKNIDAEILALKDSIQALLAFRNTFTPVYRLPPEILTRVFCFVQKAYKNYSSIGDSPFKWLILTHVSQHWRNVALKSPSLWSSISYFYPKHILEEFLQRSKAAPLDVSGTTTDQKMLISSAHPFLGFGRCG